MRVLIFITFGLASLWSGYWFWGQHQLDAQLVLTQQNAAARGVYIDAQDASISGFPNRFDITINQPTINIPTQGIMWSAPFIQLLALSYNPAHQIIVFPQQQRLQTPLGGWEITSEKLQASNVLKTTYIERFRLIGDALNVTPQNGHTFKIGQLRIASQARAALSHDIGIELSNIQIPREVMRSDTVGEAQIFVNGTISLTPAQEATATLTIHNGTFRLDQSSAQINGELYLVPRTHLQGRIEITLAGWKTLLDSNRNDALLSLLKAQSQYTGQEITFTLRFEYGQIWIGPFPVGPAPMLP